jgi:hypothetical protein
MACTRLSDARPPRGLQVISGGEIDYEDTVHCLALEISLSVPSHLSIRTSPSHLPLPRLATRFTPPFTGTARARDGHLAPPRRHPRQDHWRRAHPRSRLGHTSATSDGERRAGSAPRADRTDSSQLHARRPRAVRRPVLVVTAVGAVAGDHTLTAVGAAGSDATFGMAFSAAGSDRWLSR